MLAKQSQNNPDLLTMSFLCLRMIVSLQVHGHLTAEKMRVLSVDNSAASTEGKIANALWEPRLEQEPRSRPALLAAADVAAIGLTRNTHDLQRFQNYQGTLRLHLACRHCETPSSP